ITADPPAQLSRAIENAQLRGDTTVYLPMSVAAPLQAALQAAEQECERLKRLAAANIKSAEFHRNKWAETEAKLAALEEATQPFVKDMDWIDEGPNPVLDVESIDFDEYYRPITFADIRRLRAALSSSQVQGGAK